MNMNLRSYISSQARHSDNHYIAHTPLDPEMIQSFAKRFRKRTDF
jgi:hypothetical protein